MHLLNDNLTSIVFTSVHDKQKRRSINKSLTKNNNSTTSSLIGLEAVDKYFERDKYNWILKCQNRCDNLFLARQRNPRIEGTWNTYTILDVIGIALKGLCISFFSWLLSRCKHMPPLPGSVKCEHLFRGVSLMTSTHKDVESFKIFIQMLWFQLDLYVVRCYHFECFQISFFFSSPMVTFFSSHFAWIITIVM